MLYVGSSKITPLIYSKGGTATLTVVNHSSFDRSANEKVFLNQITGGWEIIDYASADINSITAKCDENIAKNATGTVSLSANGQLMNHEVRDFIVYGNMIVDDNTYQASFVTSDNSSYLMSKDVLNIPPSKDTSFEVFVKLETENDSNPIDLNYSETSSKNYISLISSKPGDSYTPYAPDYTSYMMPRIDMVFNNSANPFNIRVMMRSQGGNTSNTTNVTNIIIPNNWYRIVGHGSDTGLTIYDNSGNIIKSTLIGGGYHWSYNNIVRMFIGNYNTLAQDRNLKIVYDLSKCSVYKTSNGTVLWKPYKEIIA